MVGATLLVFAMAMLIVVVKPLLAQAAPGLTIVVTNSTQLHLALTNTLAGETYVIYRRSVLADPFFPWVPVQVGTPGQTAFTVGMGIETMSFFQSVSGTNWDNDTAVNWEDANPLDPNIGRLSISIDSPANGSNIQ